MATRIVGAMTETQKQITLAESLARGVKLARKKAGMSQEQLAHFSKLSRNLISNIERGKSSAGAESDPQLSTIIRLAAVLKTPPLALLFPPDEPTTLLAEDTMPLMPAAPIYQYYAWFAGLGRNNTMEPLLERMEWRGEPESLEGVIEELQRLTQKLARLAHDDEQQNGDG